jgi:hypothetical protein
VLYVYAFVERPASVPRAQGIDDAALHVESAGELDVIVSRHEALPREASEPAVLAHARVVEALAASNDAVLPARFGGAHTDTAALRAAVTDRQHELAAALARVRGCVELGVRALAPAAERTAAATGADYMRARLEHRQEAERLADELHAPLAALAREATRTVGATPRLLLSAAYLVPKDEVSGFTELVEKLQAEHPQLGIVCTGPWPPYSFATAEAA